jgi:predicted nucleotide-binding protein
MAQRSEDKIEKALELEKIQRAKAIEHLNRECDAEVSKIISDHAARGILQSGSTGARTATAHLARAQKIIDETIQLRRATIQRVPELATEQYFRKLLEDLERTADTICRSIPEHIARHAGSGGTRMRPGGDRQKFADEAMKLKAHARREVEIMRREIELAVMQQPGRAEPAMQAASAEPQPNPRRVFVVHGRNLKARDAMFTFLRSVNLDPIEWNEAVAFTGEGSPFIGEILHRAFSQATAVVVLITGDDLARLGTRFQAVGDPPHEKELTPQARPNVLFEAGMAFGRHPERTILVTLGNSRPFSDIAGRNEVRVSDRPEDRQALAGRLKTAGCDVRTEHKTDWLQAGDFDGAIQTPDDDSGDAEADRNAPVLPVPVPIETQPDDSENEELEVFKEVRHMLTEKHANTWTPEIGSKEDRIAERLVKRGWLVPGPMGGYMVRRRF